LIEGIISGVCATGAHQLYKQFLNRVKAIGDVNAGIEPKE